MGQDKMNIFSIFCLTVLIVNPNIRLNLCLPDKFTPFVLDFLFDFPECTPQTIIQQQLDQSQTMCSKWTCIHCQQVKSSTRIDWVCLPCDTILCIDWVCLPCDTILCIDWVCLPCDTILCIDWVCLPCDTKLCIDSVCLTCETILCNTTIQYYALAAIQK